MKFSQWDVAWARINPGDSDEHPAVIVSREEVCADERKALVNVLYGSIKRPSRLKGGDGDSPERRR